MLIVDKLGRVGRFILGPSRVGGERASTVLLAKNTCVGIRCLLGM